MNEQVPTFAVVGAVNAGKSSVVATLAEDRKIEVSDESGTTTKNRASRFWLRRLFVFWDTPGFQNAGDALKRLDAAKRVADPLGEFRQFVESERDNKKFKNECELLTTILEGASIIYVADASEEPLQRHTDEMEILRLTGAPCLAIINRTDADNPHALALWRARLNQNFGEPIEFNAHYATFADRIELLRTLSNRKKSWREPLLQAIEVLEMDWRDRIGKCATIIVELLEKCLTHSEAEPAADKWAKCERQTEELKRKFREAICESELEAHRAIAEHFRHSIADLALGDGLFKDELFSKETWKMLGMNAAWLTIVTTGTGLGAGGIIDAHVGVVSWGAGAAIGGAAGFVTGVSTGKRQPKIELKGWFGLKKKVAGSEIRVGPYTATGFPWILIDRAVATFVHVAHRAHALPYPLKIDSQAMKQVMDDLGVSTARWPKTELIACEWCFLKIRKGTAKPKHFKKLHRAVEDHLLKTLSQRMPVSQTALVISQKA